MQSIEPVGSSVNICCASDENYAPYLTVSLFSLLKNADKSRRYDIIILHSSISPESRGRILRLGERFPCCSIRFADVSERHDSVRERVSSYITAATNYRLFILGELFAKYDRIIYLDCDTVVEGNIAELFDSDLGAKSIGACEMVEARHFIASKRALFFGNYPYNFKDYCRKILGIGFVERYFNAGVILFDLKRCRKLTSEEKAIEVLNRKEWIYNDQDALNILFNCSVKMLDLKWNYTNNIEQYANSEKPSLREIYADTPRTEYGIIHFIGGTKPWQGDVPLCEHYHKYDKLFGEEFSDVKGKQREKR